MIRWIRPLIGATIACAAVGIAAPATHAQPPTNDDCATPTAIAGTGNFNFDNALATASPEGQGIPGCSAQPGALTNFAHDVFFCWTPDCDGIVTITTCGLTQVDTVIALYRGCACPGPAPDGPICCNDDTFVAACDLQSTIRCDVRCDQGPYMIRIGTKAGRPGGPGAFSISCEGTPCGTTGGTCPPATDVCCGSRPRFADPAYASFTGTVGLATYRPTAPGAPYVLGVINLDRYYANLPGVAPINTNWPGYSPIYYPPSATPANLGNIFGLTLDGAGNIYLAQTSSYSGDAIGGLAAGVHGSIYQIDGVTGTAYNLISLPNTNGTGQSEDWPELGNLHWDCAHNQMFASNLDDGRIYRINLASAHAGAILSNFDHATGTITSGPPASLPEAGDAPGFAPLGERVWAVQAYGGRLYYSVWCQDLAQPGTGPNKIYSIGLTGAGEFTGAPQLEITMPATSGGSPASPVADISFSPTGLMLVGERCMTGDTSLTAHQGRVFEYQCNNGTWVLSANNPFTPGAPNSSTGGVDYDNAPAGRVWMMADAIHLGGGCDLVYGIQGTPATGGSVANSIIIDVDSDTCSYDKTQLGDVEITCYVPPCMGITDGRILCDTDPTTNCFTYNFTVTNNSTTTAHYVLLAPQPGSGVTFTPNILPLTPPLLPGQSRSLSTVVCGAPCAGDGCQVCFTMFLVDEHIEACCSLDHCIDVPDCSCGQVPDDTIVCVGGNTYTYTFTIQNLTPSPVHHLFLFAPAGVTVSPTYVSLAPGLAPNATAGPFVVTITGAAGSEVCLTMSIHNHALQLCCSFVHCFTLPTPCVGPINTPPDIILHPAPVGVNAGDPAVFTVGVIGSPALTYQWRRNGVDLVDNARYQGCTTGTITIYPTVTPDTGIFDVVVTNSFGQDISQGALLDVFCAVDLNHNHSIEPADIALFITIWSNSLANNTLDGDFDGNGRVEPSDVGMFVNTWFASINGC